MNSFRTKRKVLIEYTVSAIRLLDDEKTSGGAGGGKQFRLIDEELVDVVAKIRRLVSMHCALVELKRRSAAAFKDINILTVLKNSKLFVTNFLKHAMSWLDHAFSSHKADVVGILHELQRAVLYLQSVCLTQKNAALSKQTPVYVRAVETFSLRVKQLLYVNNAEDAFTVDLLQQDKKSSATTTTTKTKATKATAQPKAPKIKKEKSTKSTTKKTSSKGKKKGQEEQQEEEQEEEEQDEDVDNETAAQGDDSE